MAPPPSALIHMSGNAGVPRIKSFAPSFPSERPPLHQRGILSMGLEIISWTYLSCPFRVRMIVSVERTFGLSSIGCVQESST